MGSHPNNQNCYNLIMKERHRFEISKEEAIAARIHAVQEGVRNLQTMYPEVVSFAAFGSMVKGNADKDSDIDGRVFVDTDLASQLEGSGVDVEIGWSPVDSEKPQSGSIIFARLEADEKKRYENLIKAALAEADPYFQNDKVEHIEALPVTKKVVATILDIWHKSEAEQRTGKMSGPQTDKIVGSEYLPQLFFLDIGRGNLKEYRQQIVTTLMTYGSIGESMWKKIIVFVEIMERKINPSDIKSMKEGATLTDIHYPRTLKEAYVAYCS